MRNAIKQNVTVQRGGRIEVFVPELPEGTAAEVIVLGTAREESAVRKTMLAGVIGKGKGLLLQREKSISSSALSAISGRSGNEAGRDSGG